MSEAWSARKKRSSFKDLTPEQREDKWADDNFTTTNEPGRKDRAQLLSLVRGAPNWQQALCGMKRDVIMTDAELTRTIGLLDAPRDTLRLAGLKHEAVVRCLALLPSALAYDPHFVHGIPRKSCCAGIKLRHRLTAALLMITIALVGSSVLILFYSKNGWTDGLCNIKQFWNATLDSPCTGNCVFDIEVRSGVLLLTKLAWTPQRQKDWTTSDISFPGAPFRCCSMSGTLNCCEFMETQTLEYCDNWPHREAPDGTSCPAGNWPCLFKLDPNDEKAVMELKPEEESPMTRNLFIAAAVFAVATICMSLTGLLWRCSIACLTKLRILPDPDSMKKLREARRASQESAPGPRRNSLMSWDETQTVQVQAQTTAEPSQRDSRLAVRRDSISTITTEQLYVSEMSVTPSQFGPPSDAPEEELEPVAVRAEVRPVYGSGTSAPPAATRVSVDYDVNGARYDSHKEPECEEGVASWAESAKPKTLFDTWQKESAAGAAGGKTGDAALRELAARSVESDKEWRRPIITPPHSQQGMHSSRRRASSTHRGGTGTSRLADTSDPGARAGLRLGSRNPGGRVAADDPRSWGWALQSDEVDSTHVIDIGSSTTSPHGSSLRSSLSTSPSRSTSSKKRTLANPQALNARGSGSSVASQPKVPTVTVKAWK